MLAITMLGASSLPAPTTDKTPDDQQLGTSSIEDNVTTMYSARHTVVLDIHRLRARAGHHCMSQFYAEQHAAALRPRGRQARRASWPVVSLASRATQW